MKKNRLLFLESRNRLRLTLVATLLPAAMLCDAAPALGYATLATSAETIVDVTITGRVTDEKGEAIPGVTVLLKGTTIGVSTDGDGAFSLLLPNSTGTLVFSSIGYISQEVPLEGRTTITLKLRTDLKTLNDVVVVGYGTQRREDLTGAISSVSAKEISQTVATTADQALQGRVAGVVVTQNSGQPGGGVSVRVRGIGTLNGDQEPLYVIDGVYIPPAQRDARAGTYTGNSGSGINPLSTISPSEIESIDVLKDASAIAIYGAQAANGVVIVTTKRGKSGAPKIDVESYYALQQLPKELPVMNLPQYATYNNAKAAITGYNPKPELINPAYLGEGTNWQKEIFRTVPMYNASIRLSGGDERTQYALSGSYLSQDGIALSSGFKRASARINLDNKTTKWLKIGTSLQFSDVRENINASNYDLINAAIRVTPDIPVRNPDGSFGGPTGSLVQSYNPNPVAAASLNTNRTYRDQALGNIYGEIYFLKHFTLRNEVSGNFDIGSFEQFFPTFTVGDITSNQNSAFQSSSKSTSWTTRNFLTYNQVFNKIYSVTALLGHEASSGQFESLSAGRRNFPSNNVTTIGVGDATTATNDGSRGDWAVDSYFGRLNLGIADRYLVTGTVRRDGSSNFAAGNKWVTTYSYALAWKLSSEAFLKDISALSELKLRVGYGLTNNQNVGAYVYGARLSVNPSGLGQSVLVSNIANPLAEWETTKGYNVGVDVAVFNNRVRFTADAYTRQTNGLLLSLPLPLYAGTNGTGALSPPVYNIGSIRNKGLEFLLNTQNIDTKGFSWTSGFTMSLNRNRIESLNTETSAITQSVDNASQIISRTSVGQPIGSFYGYEVEGMFNKASDFEGAALPVGSDGQPLPIDRVNGVWVGDLKFKDVNGDGIIDVKDLVSLGSPIPKFQYGLTNTFNYKGFDLTVFINGNYGNKIFNYTRRRAEDLTDDYSNHWATVSDFARVELIDPNGSASDVDNVYVANAGTTMPGIRLAGDPNQNSRISSRYVEDGSYLRIKNVILGYQVPKELVSRAHLSSVRVYANVQNLATFTKYTGYDPEVGASVYPNSPLLFGFDWGRYPTQRVYTLGINFGF